MITNKELVYSAFSMWINNITTGDICVSEQDFINMGNSRDDLHKLSEDQTVFVNKLKELRKQVLCTGKI